MKFDIGRTPTAAFLCAAALAASGCGTPPSTERQPSPPPYREVPAPGYGFGNAGGYKPPQPAAAAGALAGEVLSVEATSRAAPASEGRPRGAADGPWRIVVRLDDGTQRAFALAQTNEWRVGDRVRVVENQLVRE